MVVDAVFYVRNILQNPPHPCEQFPEFTFIDLLNSALCIPR
jgi:hypothetical protein